MIEMLSIKRLVRLLGYASIVPMTAQPVFAQARAGEPVDQDVKLDEIVVTAQKKSENLQDTPLSVTVVSGNDLARTGVSDVRAMTGAIPNVQIATTGSNTMVTIRGIGINASPVQTDQAVSVNIDGVYMARANSINGSYFDIDRVELLRGPQGTLYGRNSTAGALNIFTNLPRPEFAASVSAEVGNLDSLRFGGMLNVPMSPALGARVAFQSNRRDGFMSNGSGKVDSDAIRGHLLIEPTSSLSILLSADYLHLGGDASSWKVVGTGGKFDSSFDQAGAYQDNTQWGLKAEVNWHLDDMTLTYIGARREMDTDIAVKAAFALNEISYDRVWTHELRLGSNGTGAALQWLIGGYLLNQTGSYESRIQSGALQSINLNPVQGAKAQAIFGQATWSLTDWLRATGGLRVSWDEKFQDGIDALGTPFSSRDKWRSTNWKAILEADVAPDSMIYANVSTGFRAGGFHGGSPPNSFRPEKLKAYAIGSKNEFVGGKARFNVEAFYFDYRDLQIGYLDFINPFPAFGNRISNVGKAKVYGIEAEASIRFTRHDRIDASASYLHGTYEDFVVPGSLYPPPNGRPAVDYSGQRMTRSPTWSGRISYSHDWDLRNGDGLSFNAATYGASAQWLDFVHVPQSRQKAFAKIDASLSYTMRDHNVQILVFGRNLTNTAVANSFTRSGALQVQLDLPRTYGIGVTASF